MPVRRRDRRRNGGRRRRPNGATRDGGIAASLSGRGNRRVRRDAQPRARRHRIDGARATTRDRATTGVAPTGRGIVGDRYRWGRPLCLPGPSRITIVVTRRGAPVQILHHGPIPAWRETTRVAAVSGAHVATQLLGTGHPRRRLAEPHSQNHRKQCGPSGDGQIAPRCDAVPSARSLLKLGDPALNA